MKSRLNFAFVKSVKHSGRNGPDKYHDEHGLILRVRASGSKNWFWRGTVQGRRRELGLGAFPYVSLAEAREKALDYRTIARAGRVPASASKVDRPLSERETSSSSAGAAPRKPANSGAPAFRTLAAEVIDFHRPTWRNPRSAAQWASSLRDYVYPAFGNKPVDEVTTADVLRALQPIWNTKRETARRTRQRISAVMKAAIAAGHRADNPAADALTSALPKGGQVQNHQRALPHDQVADALATVRASNAHPSTKLAFEFLVFTAARSGEVRLMVWDEIDLDARLWTVPAERMKAQREHRVPLSVRAVDLLAEAAGFQENELVFPSATGRPMSDATLSKLIRELGINAVPHGFRSSFRDWCGDTGQPRELAEAALAHTIRNKAEAAYARSDLLERRRTMMQAWSAYLSAPTD